MYGRLTSVSTMWFFSRVFSLCLRVIVWSFVTFFLLICGYLQNWLCTLDLPSQPFIPSERLEMTARALSSSLRELAAIFLKISFCFVWHFSLIDRVSLKSLISVWRDSFSFPCWMRRSFIFSLDSFSWFSKTEFFFRSSFSLSKVILKAKLSGG